MDSIPDLFWILCGMGVAIFGAFAGLALLMGAVRDRVHVTMREEEEV